ncbi:metallophosphoesterase [bacterium]|nr:metallophosphoesterase [bacterium]
MVIQKFSENYHGRDFVMGDLHGCYDLLMTRLEEIEFDREKDRLFAVGDLVDRGTKSLKCLELIFEPWFHSVLGNHEEMMFCGLLDESAGEYQCWVQNGGLWHLDYLNNAHNEAYLLEILAGARYVMPLAFQIDTKEGHTVGILHADPPEFWNEALIRDLRMSTLWGRHRWQSKNTRAVKDIYKVYVGHTPTGGGIVTLGNVHYIDTGAQWTGELTILEI